MGTLYTSANSLGTEEKVVSALFKFGVIMDMHKTLVTQRNICGKQLIVLQTLDNVCTFEAEC